MPCSSTRRGSNCGTPWQLFAGAIADYKILPDWAVNPLACTLPWAELAIGLLIAAGLWLRTAASACSLLLAVFFSLMVRAYVTHQEISCGCFGPGELISWRTLLRDGTLLGGLAGGDLDGLRAKAEGGGAKILKRRRGGNAEKEQKARRREARAASPAACELRDDHRPAPKPIPSKRFLRVSASNDL